MSHKNLRIGLVSLLVIAMVVYLLVPRPSPSRSIEPTTTPMLQSTLQPLAAATKSSECQVRADLPDPACTPGAVFAQATTAQICVKGYTTTVRNVSVALKNEIFSEYGITSHSSGQYEVDHLIPLELGGSNDRANLWPEAADPTPGFHEKDLVENYLHREVCAGRLPLDQAQKSIAGDWTPFLPAAR